MLLLAPPGTGRGTQGERLADRLGVQHVSAGELLRAEARAGTPAGRQIAAYQQRGILVAVDADQPPEAVTAEILARLPASSPTRGRP